MGSCHELNFKLQNPFVPVSVDVFLKDISVVQDITDRWEKMNDYMQRLEDEMRKIDVFKRELPLSMVLLEDAIKTLKEKMNCFDRSTPSPVMKEFLPVASRICDDEDEGDDNSGFVTEENDCTDKINWKNSLQLWTRSDDNDHQDEANQDSKKNNLKQTEMDSSQANTKINGNQKYVYGHGAFSPFKLTSSFQAIFRKENQNPMVPDLSLMSGCTENYMDESDSSNSKSETRVLLSSSSSSKSSLNTQSQQSLRKTRRCWSPDLHKRFLHVLEQLGGAQVATPKQIRELMKVDGLTNDEVKSHLQKYRLHARRVPSSSKIENQQKMVLKGIWIPHENYPLNQQSISKSRSPTSSLQLENDRKSESYSWKGYGKRSDEDVTQSLAGSSKFLQICAQ